MSSPELQIGLVEARRLIRNPVVWLALAVMTVWAVAGAGSPEDEYMLLVGFGLVLPGCVVAGHLTLAVLRSRRHHTDSLFDVLPVGRPERAIGHGMSSLAGGLIGVVVTAAAYVAVRPPSVLGTGIKAVGATFPRPNLAQVLQGPLAVVVLGAAAVALARWVPNALVLLLFAAFTVVQGVIAGIFFGVPSGRGVAWLWPLSSGMVHGKWNDCVPDCILPVSGFDQSTPWWHLGYLAGLSAMFVAIAVLRDRRDRRAWLALIVAVATVIGFAIAQFIVHQPYPA